MREGDTRTRWQRMTGEDRLTEDVQTLAVTVLGTFNIGNYTVEERRQIWQRVGQIVEREMAKESDDG